MANLDFINPETLRRLWRSNKSIEKIAGEMSVSSDSIILKARAIGLVGRNLNRGRPARQKVHLTPPKRIFSRRYPTFSPPPWTTDLDEELFSTEGKYDAISAFSKTHGIAVSVAINRFHLVAK